MEIDQQNFYVPAANQSAASGAQSAPVDAKIKDLNDLNDQLKRINEKQHLEKQQVLSSDNSSQLQVLENKAVEAIDEAKRELKLELEKLHEAGTTVNQVSTLIRYR